MNGTFNEENCLKNLEDEKLVEKFNAGQKDAFEILFKRYNKMIYNLSYRFLYFPEINREENKKNSEDATQDIFCKVLKNLKKFKGKSLFKTWLYRITINHLKNKRREIIRKIEKFIYI